MAPRLAEPFEHETHLRPWSTVQTRLRHFHNTGPHQTWRPHPLCATFLLPALVSIALKHVSPLEAVAIPRTTRGIASAVGLSRFPSPSGPLPKWGGAVEVTARIQFSSPACFRPVCFTGSGGPLTRMSHLLLSDVVELAGGLSCRVPPAGGCIFTRGGARLTVGMRRV